MMIGHVFRKILHFESQQIPVFSVFAPKRGFFDEKIAKNEQKMRKNRIFTDFFKVSANVSKRCLRGLGGLWELKTRYISIFEAMEVE